MQTNPRPRREVRRIGTVTSDAMDKTVIVTVERRVRHPRYNKYVRRFTRLHVHDEHNRSSLGDTVEVVFTRPLSRSKRWRLVRIVPAGGAAS